MTTTDSSAIWQHWMQQLLATAQPGGLGTGQQFCAGAMTLAVDLADADPLISALSVYELGDVVPADSPTYSPAGGLCVSYATFLDFIDPGGSSDPNLQSQINRASGALTAAQQNFDTQQSAAAAQFTTYKQINPNADFPTWVASQYPVYGAAQSALTAALSAYQQLMIQAYGPGYATIAAARTDVGADSGAQSILMQNSFNMAVKSGTVAPAGSGPALLPGQTPPTPSQNLESSFRPAYALDNSFVTRYQEWQTASTSGSGGSVVITVGSTAQSLDWSSFGWSGSIEASLLADFFSIGLSGQTSGETFSIDTTSSNFSLSVSFVGLGTFSINPGNWWGNGSLIGTYGGKLRPDAPDFFGDSGALARRATQAVIGFEPTITLTMDSDDYQDAKTTWQAQATLSVGIGPFKLGDATVNTNGGKEQMQFDDANEKITIGPIKSTVPLLLGVIAQRLGPS